MMPYIVLSIRIRARRKPTCVVQRPDAAGQWAGVQLGIVVVRAGVELRHPADMNAEVSIG